MVTGVGANVNDEAVRGCSWDDVESALRRGWKVFPVWGVRGRDGQFGMCACPKGTACNEPGKHPAVAGGFRSALGEDSAFAVAAWWSGEPRNLGVATGVGSDLLVVDVDVRSGGADSFDVWQEATGLDWPGGGRVHTGRGGVESVGAGGHWYLRWPSEWRRLGREAGGKVGVLPGIDVRGDGGYVLGVGSAHVAGGVYQWLPGWGSRELPEAAEGFMTWLRDARPGARYVGGGAGSGSGSGGGLVGGYSFKETWQGGPVGTGGRDVYFNDLAFRLRVSGLSRERAELELRREWERAEQPTGDRYEWETAREKLARVWATVPDGGFPQTEDGGRGRARGRVSTPRAVTVASIAPVSGVPIPPPIVEAVDTKFANVMPVMPVVPETPQIPPAALIASEILKGAPVPYVGMESIVPPPPGGGGGLVGEVLSPGAEEAHDTGNGLRFTRLFAGKALYVRELAAWFCWDEDGIWKFDKVGRALEWTKEVVSDIRAEAELARLAGENDLAATWYKWSHATASLAKRENMLRSASVEAEMRTETDELDSNRWLMALRGGMTIDLRTGEIRQSDPRDMITKCAGVSWEDVTAARAGGLERGWVGGLWDQHIMHMVKGDKEAAGWLRRMAGYCLTGSVEEQTMAFNHGEGENGKNVFMETLLAVWGDYAVKGQAGILTAADDEHPVGLYGLRGARLVFVDEVGRARINETRLKDITGGAIMRARDIGASWVEFEMQGKVWVNANNLPAIKDSSHGMWRRVRVAELRGQLGKDGWEREPGFAERLQNECRGEVLAWALDGLKEWQATGLGTYADMERIGAQYRDEEDMFGMFVKECLMLQGHGLHPLADPRTTRRALEEAKEADTWTDQRSLYSSYQMWCALSQDRRDRVLNYSHFGRELRRAVPGLVIERGRAEGGRTQKVYGLELKSMN